MKNRAGELVYARRWGKRMKKWYCVPVTEPEKYEYITDTVFCSKAG